MLFFGNYWENEGIKNRKHFAALGLCLSVVLAFMVSTNPWGTSTTSSAMPTVLAWVVTALFGIECFA
jgi:hypothetical protein